MCRMDQLPDTVMVSSNYFKRRRHDLSMAPVISVQKNPLRVRIVLSEALHTVGTCAPESIDRLVVIPYDKQILFRSRKQFYDFVLHRRYILELIHENVLELLLPHLQYLRLFQQQSVTENHNIIEIHLSKFLLISFIFFQNKSDILLCDTPYRKRLSGC